MTPLLRLLKISVDVCWYIALALPFAEAVPPWGLWILWGLPAVYAGIVLIKRQTFASHGANQELFTWQCGILAVGCLFECLTFGVDKWWNSLVWACVFLALGVLLLRISRLGEEYQKDKGFWLRNILALAGVLFLILLGTSQGFLGAVQWVLNLIYSYVIAPVIMAIATVLAFFAEGLLNFIAGLFPKLNLEGLAEDMVQAPDNTIEDVPLTQTTVSPVFTYLAWAVVIIVGLIILRAVYKKLTSARWSKSDNTGAVVIKSAIAEAPKGYEAPPQSREEKSVRAYYRRFLRMCRRRGMEILPQESSGEIQEKAGKLWPPQELPPLRQVYINARYGGETGKAHVAKAREEYRKLKSIKQDK